MHIVNRIFNFFYSTFMWIYVWKIVYTIQVHCHICWLQKAFKMVESKEKKFHLDIYSKCRSNRISTDGWVQNSYGKKSFNDYDKPSSSWLCGMNRSRQISLVHTCTTHSIQSWLACNILLTWCGRCWWKGIWIITPCSTVTRL